MTYRDVAPTLFANGWRSIIPLTLAKGTHIKWGPIQRKDMTQATLDYFLERYGDAPRTGLVFGPERGLVALDVDFEELITAELLREAGVEITGGTAFARIGKAPKFLGLFRGNVKSQRLLCEDGGIDVFGSSGQVAIYGPHPTAGKDYEWPAKGLLDHTPADLPEITQAQVTEFLEYCKHHVTPRSKAGHIVTWADSDDLRLERRLNGVNAAAKQLQGIKRGHRHLVLLGVTGFLVERGHAARDVARFVERWFPQEHRTEEYADIHAEALKMATSAAGKGWQAADWELKDEE